MRNEIAPGAVHLPAWLDVAEQRELVSACREWVRPPVGMRAIRTRGGVMSARTACLGWYWYPYRYSRTADDADGATVKAFPNALSELGHRALTDAGADWPGYAPDVALINFYDADARMGMHQDRDEHSLAPVVSVSLGDTGVFRFGNVAHRNKPWTDLELRSGDLFVFGAESRLAFHGVVKIIPGSGPAIGIGVGIDPANRDTMTTVGRLNITLRESGLS